MCFSSGGSSGSSSSSTSSNATTVNVSSSTQINTADLADAIDALAGAQKQQASLTFLGQVANARATVAAAQVSAKSETIWYVAGGTIAVLGLLLSAGVIRVPRALKAA